MAIEGEGHYFILFPSAQESVLAARPIANVDCMQYLTLWLLDSSCSLLLLVLFHSEGLSQTKLNGAELTKLENKK